MSPVSTPPRPFAAAPSIDLAPPDHTPYAAPEPAPPLTDELSDDDLEQVVGGLARTWTDALRASRHQV